MTRDCCAAIAGKAGPHNESVGLIRNRDANPAESANP